MVVRIINSDALAALRTLESESVNCVVTSPPYYGLRSYGTEPQTWGGIDGHPHEWDTVRPPGYRSSDTKPGPLQHPGNMGRERLTSGLCACGAWRGELGHEPTPAMFIEHLVAIFEEVRRVLRSDGTCWVNLGDSYWTRSAMRSGGNREQIKAMAGEIEMPSWVEHAEQGRVRYSSGHPTLKDKDLTLIPERFAIGMQDAGWWVRSQIVWAKKSCMPESVRDRPTSAWEPIWLLTKSRRYWYDADAVRQPHARLWESNNGGTMANPAHEAALSGQVHQGKNHRGPYPLPNAAGANLRNYWLLGPEPFSGEHFAGFPTELPRRCILAGSRKGDTVLDPFLGSGTTALVADRLGRDAIGIELNSQYAEMARRRIEQDAGPLMSEPVEVVAAGKQASLFGDAAPVADARPGEMGSGG